MYLFACGRSSRGSPSWAGSEQGQRRDEGVGGGRVPLTCIRGPSKRKTKKSLVLGWAAAYVFEDDGDHDDDGKYWNDQGWFAHVRAQSGPKSTPHNPDQVPDNFNGQFQIAAHDPGCPGMARVTDTGMSGIPGSPALVSVPESPKYLRRFSESLLRSRPGSRIQTNMTGDPRQWRDTAPRQVGSWPKALHLLVSWRGQFLPWGPGARGASGPVWSQLNVGTGL